MKLSLRIFIAALTLGGLFLSSLYSYVLFHSLAELFSIVIGCGIFMLAWNVRQFLKNQYLMVLGIAYLFVAILDLVHMLTYSGMNIFRGYGSDLPTQLWVAARSVESLSLLFAPLLLRRKLKAELLVAVYAALTALLLVSTFAGLFPRCYIEGAGLTPFKRASEYAICLILLGAVGLLLKKKDAFEPQVLRWLVWSIVLMIGSELSFTFYVRVYDLPNLVGHFLKIVSFYLIYKAIVETGLSKPYALIMREMARTNENLERLVQERTARYREVIHELETLSYGMVHDMRAPLRAMQGYAQVLVEEGATATEEEKREHLGRIMNAALTQDHFIQDVLTYMQVVRQQVQPQGVNLDQLLQQTLERYPEIKAARAAVHIEAPLGEATGDGPSLVQCFGNLLSNALKFVPKGMTPNVRIWSEPRDGKVRVWVEDKGIGIVARHQDRLFKLFERLNAQTEYRGNGLGLAVVKKAVEHMGGEVGVESEYGKGSRFWFEIPR